MSTAITLNDMELAILMQSLAVVQVAMEKNKTTPNSQITISQLKNKLDNQFHIQILLSRANNDGL